MTVDQPPDVPADRPRPLVPYAAALVAGAVLFGGCNVLWRLGSGDAIALVLQRSLVGVVLVLPVLGWAARNGRLRAVAVDPWAVAAVLAAGTTLAVAGFFFRWLPGPQAALVLAVLPALLLLPSRILTGRTAGAALPFVLLAVLAASGAAATGGVGSTTTPNVVTAMCFLLVSMTASLTMERARRRHSSWVLVSCGMVAGALGSALALFAGGSMGAWSIQNLLIAAAIALLGTAGRILQAFALPHLGAVVSSTGAQVTAMITAGGGIVFFADALSGPAMGLGLAAAAAAIAATVLAGRAPGRGERPAGDR